ncbi:MAG: hypothetical protein KDC38_07830 [Planctomycetes bacterium]|nr:hypothetical protein [Planctomycetota bacterium]
MGRFWRRLISCGLVAWISFVGVMALRSEAQTPPIHPYLSRSGFEQLASLERTLASPQFRTLASAGFSLGPARVSVSPRNGGGARSTWLFGSGSPTYAVEVEDGATHAQTGGPPGSFFSVRLLQSPPLTIAPEWLIEDSMGIDFLELVLSRARRAVERPFISGSTLTRLVVTRDPGRWSSPPEIRAAFHYRRGTTERVLVVRSAFSPGGFGPLVVESGP